MRRWSRVICFRGGGYTHRAAQNPQNRTITNTIVNPYWNLHLIDALGLSSPRWQGLPRWDEIMEPLYAFREPGHHNVSSFKCWTKFRLSIFFSWIHHGFIQLELDCNVSQTFISAVYPCAVHGIIKNAKSCLVRQSLGGAGASWLADNSDVFGKGWFGILDKPWPPDWWSGVWPDQLVLFEEIWGLKIEYSTAEISNDIWYILTAKCRSNDDIRPARRASRSNSRLELLTSAPEQIIRRRRPMGHMPCFAPSGEHNYISNIRLDKIYVQNMQCQFQWSLVACVERKTGGLHNGEVGVKTCLYVVAGYRRVVSCWWITWIYDIWDCRMTGCIG